MYWLISQLSALYDFSLCALDEEKARAIFEIGKDGKLILKKKKIDLNNITAAELRALGIDPTLSAVEIAKKLKVRLGSKTHS